MDEQQIFEKLWEQAPLLAAALFALFAGHRGWWAYGRELKQRDEVIIKLTAERDRFFDLLMKATENSRSASLTAARAVDVMKGPQ
jgi:hypothetical protein